MFLEEGTTLLFCKKRLVLHSLGAGGSRGCRIAQMPRKVNPIGASLCGIKNSYPVMVFGGNDWGVGDYRNEICCNNLRS